MTTPAAWQEPEQLMTQYRVQYIHGEDQPRSRFFIRLEEAQALADSLIADTNIKYARVDRRMVSRWTGVA